MCAVVFAKHGCAAQPEVDAGCGGTWITAANTDQEPLERARSVVAGMSLLPLWWSNMRRPIHHGTSLQINQGINSERKFEG